MRGLGARLPPQITESPAKPIPYTEANIPLREIYASLPKPMFYGFLAGYLTSLLAERAFPLLLSARAEELPFAGVTEYMAVAVAWSPYPAGIIAFLFFLFLEYRNARRDNR